MYGKSQFTKSLDNSLVGFNIIIPSCNKFLERKFVAFGNLVDQFQEENGYLQKQKASQILHTTLLLNN